jgi:argininosuccinate synthase
MFLAERIKDIKKAPAGAVLAKLNGENITKEHLISLIKDTTVPVTQSLAQVSSSSHGDDDILSSLLGNNITRAALKNLVTDKPAPITMKLAQVSSSDSSLLGQNVSKDALKNLVTDKPAPVTAKLAQIEKSDVKLAQTSGSPVTVNPESMLMNN